MSLSKDAYEGAVVKILDRFQKEGYNTLITDKEFDFFIGMTSLDPDAILTVAEHEQRMLDRLQIYQAIHEVLKQHKLCLLRAKAGFTILHPRDQITIAFGKKMKKIKREIKKANITVTSVDNSCLSMEEANVCLKNQERIAFIKKASDGRRTFES
jgi:hypothetical protein